MLWRENPWKTVKPVSKDQHLYKLQLVVPNPLSWLTVKMYIFVSHLIEIIRTHLFKGQKAWELFLQAKIIMYCMIWYGCVRSDPKFVWHLCFFFLRSGLQSATSGIDRCALCRGSQWCRGFLFWCPCFFVGSSLQSANQQMFFFRPGGLDSLDPRKWLGDSDERGKIRIGSQTHWAPSHQFATESWSNGKLIRDVRRIED